MIAGLVSIVLCQAAWPGFHVNQCDMSFKMPNKPQMQQGKLNNAPTVFYVTDTPEGHFVAGYVAFPDEIQGQMQQLIQTNPGSPAVRNVIEVAIGELAKVGKAKITSPEFGSDRGLPAEFATLKSDKATLQVHVYLGSKATYLFITNANPLNSGLFFSGIKLPPELRVKTSG